jgi:hypothetical protein
MNRIACFLLPAVLGALASVQEASSSWDFSGDEVEKEPGGFYFDETDRAPAAKWRVVEHDGGRVLAQLDRSRGRNRSALAVVKDSRYEDLKLTVRIKAVEGSQDQSGGVVWRYRNSENYLLARLSVSGRNVRLYRVVRGNRVKFGEEDDLRLKPNTWYTLRVEHKGDRIKVYLNDDVLFVERDRHFRDAGKIGLWSGADSLTYFDDFRVQKLEDDNR